MTSCNPSVPASALAGIEACNDPACPGRGQPAARCMLVLTHLVPGTSAMVVADIFKRCRERHAQLGVTGTVLFDGERFGLWVCGQPEPVGQAVDAFTSDPRQAWPLVLSDLEEVPTWAPRIWHAGWCEPDALAPLTAADAPQGPAAVETWRALMAASDLL